MLERWLEAAIEVIPAVDVLGEGAVRLHQGAYDEVVARAGDPVDLARAFAEAGAARIHLVALDDARALLEAGAGRVVVGTAAFPDPAPWAELGEQLVVALDVRDGQVRTAGWTEASGLM